MKSNILNTFDWELPNNLSFEDALKMVKEEMAQQDREVQQISKSLVSTRWSKKESKTSKSNRSKSKYKDKKKKSKQELSQGESIAEEIDNSEYEMEFGAESEVETDTTISTVE